MIAIYPGSFDPVTRGHLDIIRRALVFCPQLVVAMGSNGAKKNLFTIAERTEMIKGALQDNFSADEIARIKVAEFSGAVIDYADTIGATLIVRGMRSHSEYPHEEKMAIINRRLSNKVDTVFLMTENDLRDVSSTSVREMARINLAPEKLDHYVTPNVRDLLLAKIKA